ncbi:MAG: hypothetical protein E7641_08720 [Ruminococcaceae bacterium]|nr:hypothetical protein [Oscillospiraceae bacterium]
MFSVGSFVSYRAEGVCEITDIRNENFGTVGKDTLYYILSPIHDKKSTFFVPVDNEKLVSMMRKLLSADEIGALIEEQKGVATNWISDSKQRASYFREVLSLGERHELILLVRAVSEFERTQAALGRKVYTTDLSAKERAAKLLLDEFSVTLPITGLDELYEMIL